MMVKKTSNLKSQMRRSLIFAFAVEPAEGSALIHGLATRDLGGAATVAAAGYLCVTAAAALGGTAASSDGLAGTAAAGGAAAAAARGSRSRSEGCRGAGGGRAGGRAGG